MKKLKKLSKNKKITSKVLIANRCIVLDKQGRILLLQRSFKDVFDPGKWEFPGGKLEQGQDTSNALEKEVLEEAGIMVVPITYIAYTYSEVNTSGKYKGYTYVLIVGIAKHINGQVILSEEHETYKWVTEKEALKMDIRDEIRKALIVLFPTIKNILRKDNKK
jgi:8-oxo-dGTP diphosphatase